MSRNRRNRRRYCMSGFEAPDDRVDGFGQLLFKAPQPALAHGSQDNDRQSNSAGDGANDSDEKTEPCKEAMTYAAAEHSQRSKDDPGQSKARPRLKDETVQRNKRRCVVALTGQASAPPDTEKLSLRGDLFLILGCQPGSDLSAAGDPPLDCDIHRKNQGEDGAENKEGRQVMGQHASSPRFLDRKMYSGH